MISRGRTSRENRRAVGYVRRSTDRQEQAIPDQKKAIEDYAIERGLRFDRYYVDDAISGTSTAGRRAFLEMIRDAQSTSQPFDVVIVYDIKRFGRVDNDEAGYYRHLLRTNGVEVLYVSENFNGDATDDLLRPVKQWQARQESKDLSKVTIRGLLSKMQDHGSGNGNSKNCGWWMGGVPPYGFDLRYETIDGNFLFIVRYLSDGSKQVLDESTNVTRTLARGESLSISKRDRAKLVHSSSDRVKVLQRIFSMYTEQRKGFKAIASTLNGENIPTPRGPEWSHIYSGQWTDTTIRSILVNPLYVGDMVWNRRTDARFYRISDGHAVEREAAHGARLVPNAETDWMIIREAHEPLVSRRIFDQAKEIRESHISSIEQRGRDPRTKTHGRNWNGKRSRFILSGLLKCSLCNSRYQGVTQHKSKRRSDGSRVTTFSYGCGGYITKGNSVCSMNPIAQEKLEALVINEILGLYRQFMIKDGRKKIGEEVKRQMGTEREDFKEARGRSELELQRVTQVINNLLDNITPTNREHVDQRLKELTLQRKQINTRLDELDRLTTAQSEIQTIVADAARYFFGLEFTLREGLPQEKLSSLRQCIERIHINKPEGRITITALTIPCGNLNARQTIEVNLAKHSVENRSVAI